ncbi:MAG: NAD-dependent deacylase [Deltaproteobacteria bacterium]|nr:MAG: NAD-dependent deacylase [Deltaproteobacteria bacterium]
MDELIQEAARSILGSKLTIALTGAGISVESGIPDFRSRGGLWDRFDPDEYATINSFKRSPEKVWEMLREMEETIDAAETNEAHTGLAELERMGLLQTVITQNVDNLHQEAGSRDVIEYHGNSRSLTCLWCNNSYDYKEKKGEYPPRCECGKILKPDVIFFGEAIPFDAMTRSTQLASTCQVLLIIGTSAVVFPFNLLPRQAKQAGSKIIEINLEKTALTDHIIDIFLQGKASVKVSQLVSVVRELRGG